VSIVFFGTAEFAVPILEAIRAEVSLVVTQPDRPTGRGLKLQASPVKLKAQESGLKVESPEKSRSSEFVDYIAGLKPEILLVAAYGQILSERLLQTAEHGGINLHGSILPKYRGAAPIQRSILSGDHETGVTLMQMAKGMDSGDIIEIRNTEIGPDESYGEVQARLAAIAAAQAKDWLAMLMSGGYPRVPQIEDQATYAPKIEKEEAELKFERAAAQEYNRFRAFTPAPGAYFVSRFGRVRLSSVRRSDWEGEQGTVRTPNLVAFKDGSLELLEVQPEGKRKMNGRDFFNGYRLRNGESIV
jgi:methionyl-tRNA formyltransferase